MPHVRLRAFPARISGVPLAWSLILAVVMLGPGLAPGFVLVRDMVFVPDLALGRSDVLGLGSALPRAVPSDAVVAVLDELVGGMVLQKLVLLGALVGAGTGFAALVGGSVALRLVATSVGIWNPFVVERLWIGHWPVLLGYAVLPWLILAGRRIGAGGPITPWLPLLVIVGSLSANAGLVSALALGVSAAAAGVRRRRAAALGLIVAAANAPWIVAGLTHASASLEAAGYHAFSTRADGVPAWLSVLSGGGIWNGQVVPASREGVAAWVATLLVIALAGLGARSWWRAQQRCEALALIVLWGVGVGLAWVSALAPGALGAAGEYLPGVGLLRDGTRSLALAMPLTVCLMVAGVRVVITRPADQIARMAVALAAVLAPVALLPDAAWGGGGHLRAVDYPEAWTTVGKQVDPAYGDALVLPWSTFRAPTWNDGRPVQDPMPRLLRATTVASGDLIVSTEVVGGEDPRAALAVEALGLPTPTQRSEALAGLGIGWVVTDRNSTDVSPDPPPTVAGAVTSRAGGVEVVKINVSRGPQAASVGALAAMLTAWLAFVSLTAGSLIATARRLVVKIVT